jgi:hypothetical protein
MIENAARSLQDDIQYSYGTDSDFNQDQKRAFLYINTTPLVPTPSYRNNGVANYVKSWQTEIAFFKLDREDSSPEDYAKILDTTDDLIDKFVNKLNQSEGIVLTFGAQQPFIKALADILTGHILTITILAEDSFDYCLDC